MKTTSIQEGIAKLKSLEKQNLVLAEKMLRAYNGAFYSIDMLALAALKIIIDQ